MEHLQNLDNVPYDILRPGATISAENSDRCWNRVIIVGSVCEYA